MATEDDGRDERPEDEPESTGQVSEPAVFTRDVTTKVVTPPNSPAPKASRIAETK